VHQHVHQLAERIADERPTHPPGLVRGTVFDRDLRLLHALQGHIEIVDLDREIGDEGA
jgi:hypothetical protein